ncbi:MAG: hypothetical protein ACSHWW_05600 [Nonlabens sp.]|uniref:hypothetical protein n=1 Tax=Nonlabens sp. TaxID=1888209 RepID=UPI003EF3CA49
MKKILIALIVLTSLSSAAQSFTWGYPYRITDEQDATLSYVVDDKVYKLTEFYDSKKFNTQLDVDFLNPNDLEKMGSISIEVEPVKVFGQRRDYEAMFQENGTDYTLFSSYYDKKTKKNILSWQATDIDGGELGDYNEIALVKALSMTKSGEFEIARSDSGSFYAVLVEQPWVKKKSETIDLYLLNDKKEVVKTKSFTFPFADKRSRHNEIYVSDSGQVYIVKSIDLKKQKPTKNIYNWNPDTDSINLEELKQDDNYQIAQFQGSFQEDNFLFTGILTSDNSKFFSVSMDFSGRNSGVTATGILALKYDADGKLVYNQRNDFDKSVSNLSIKDIHVLDDYYWLVMDRAQVDRKSKSGQAGAGSFEYDYTYLNNGFGIAKIMTFNGSMEFLNFIDTNEPNTRNDNGAYLSVLSFVRDGKLHLLYNETRDLRKGAVRVPLLKRFPIHDIIDPSGTLIKNEALMAAGIGVQKDEAFDLDTSSIHEISDGKYLLRAKSGVEYKYGFMQF